MSIAVKVVLSAFSLLAVVVLLLGLYTAWESLFGTREIGVDD